MKVKAVRRYASPRYPTRCYLDEHPELLKRIPERWRHNPVVLSVLSAVVFLILSRQSQAGDENADSSSSSHVAPLFVHGSGRGAFGCIVANPPVFLSEDEARQVIQDEAEKADLDFSSNALALKAVTVPVTDRYAFEAPVARREKKDIESAPTQKRDLVLDGYDPTVNVAYELVSPKDFEEWEARHGMISTVSSYDFKETAEILANGLAQTQGKTVLAVFYEPCASDMPHPTTVDTWKASEARRRLPRKQLEEEDLRQQVRDFIRWLQAQGII